MLKLYYARIDRLREDSGMERALSQLPEERRLRLRKLKSNEERLRSLAAFRLLQLGLEEEHIAPEQQTIRYGEYGKPYLADQKLYFNLSHAVEYAVCAICSQEVGADIESLSRFDGHPERAAGIAERILTKRERMRWEEAGAMSAELVRIWTRKESYAKLEGIGLSIGLSTIDTIDGAAFVQMQPDEEMYVSVCTRTPCRNMQVYERTDRI